MKKLPDKLSDLITLALNDYKKVQQDRKYSINLKNSWHDPFRHGPHKGKKCSVCLAGAVIAKSFKTPVNKYQSPANYEKTINKKLLAIDYFRKGYLHTSYLFSTDVNNYCNFTIQQIKAYKADWNTDIKYLTKISIKKMKECINYLKEIGI